MILANFDNIVILALLLIALGYALARAHVAQENFEREKDKNHEPH